MTAFVYVIKFQILKVDVENHEAGKSVPACSIELEWIYGGQQRELFHRVTIIGARQPQNAFIMRYYPITSGMSFSCVVDNLH